MITTPTDPVQDILDKAAVLRREIALLIVDESAIIAEGMDIPNQIVTTELAYESLESEPDPNKLRHVARQLSRSIERTHKQLDPWLLAQRLKQLKKMAGTRLHRMS